MEGYPTIARARFSQLVLASVGLFSTMDTAVVGLLLEPIKKDLHLSDTQVGFVHMTAYYAAYGLLAIPMGMLVDRLTRVRLLLLAVCLWCAGLVIVGLSNGLWLLAAAKGAMGVANALTYPTAMSLMADNFAPNRRAFATASYAIGQNVGSAVALLVGGLGYSALVAMVDANHDALAGIQPWRAVSLIFSGFGLLLVPMILAMREPLRMETGKGRRGSFRELLAYRTLLIPVFIGMMALAGQSSSVQTWFAPALIRLYGVQPGAFAVWSSVIFLVSSLAANVLASKLINVVRASGGTQMAMMIAAVTAALSIPGCFLAMMPTLWGFAALGALFLVAGGAAIAVAVIAINFLIPNELRGLCMGLYIVLISVAGMIGAPLTGFASQQLGGDAMLGMAIALVSAPCTIIAALAFWTAGSARHRVQMVAPE